MQITIKKFVPIKIDHRNVFVEEKNGGLVISCNKIKPPRPILISKSIAIDKTLFEIIGLYFGDGNNKDSGSANRRVAIANTCPQLQRYWINFLKGVYIKPSQLRVQVQIGTNIKKSKEAIIGFWSSELRLPKSCFIRKISIRNSKTKPYGTAVVNFNSKIFRKIFENIFAYCINKTKTDRTYAASFIRGLFAAEGYPAINKYGSLRCLDIPIINDRRREYVEQLLSNVEIQCRNNYKTQRLDITGYLNFMRFKELNLHTMHPERCKRFDEAYKNLIEEGHVPALTKIRIIDCLRKKPMTRFEIARSLNLELSTVHKSLKDLEMKKVVNFCSKSFSTNKRLLRKKWKLIEAPENKYSLMKNDYNKMKAGL